ncbi:MAG: hypothetical protein KatS3mg015_2801 [Fimbriimonadales bacterium]|nr:MAG: hypothetical protein KatS3mg015_2801 [Fimbriimonadales bacterium]
MSDRQGRLELISRLLENAAREAAVEELIELKEAYYKNLARTLSESTKPVDQRDVDYKRGFWRGALWAFQVFPKKALFDLESEIKRALEEKEREDAE